MVSFLLVYVSEGAKLLLQSSFVCLPDPMRILYHRCYYCHDFRVTIDGVWIDNWIY
jgi:hypothetical protein